MVHSRRVRGCGCVAPGTASTGRVRIAVTLALVVFAPLLSAQTIVPNPNLDAQLAPWAPFASAAPDPVGSGAAPTWLASPDLNNSPVSGSALIDIDTSAPAADAASGMVQCFDFASAQVINFVNYGASFRVPASTTADASLSATIEIRLFSGAGCSGFLSGASQGRTITAGMASDTTWYDLADNSFVPTDAPVTAASAQVRGYLRQTGGAAPSQADYHVNLDHFVLVLNSTTPVELTHFDVE